jgi:hypothetical protein
MGEVVGTSVGTIDGMTDGTAVVGFTDGIAVGEKDPPE